MADDLFRRSAQTQTESAQKVELYVRQVPTVRACLVGRVDLAHWGKSAVCIDPSDVSFTKIVQVVKVLMLVEIVNVVKSVLSTQIKSRP